MPPPLGADRACADPVDCPQCRSDVERVNLARVLDDVQAAGVLAHLRLLAVALDGALPHKQLDRNVQLATRRLELLEAARLDWGTGAASSPRCNRFSVAVMTEIVRRFDRWNFVACERTRLERAVRLWESGGVDAIASESVAMPRSRRRTGG